jgi:hypothetical protein
MIVFISKTDPSAKPIQKVDPISIQKVNKENEVQSGSPCG